MPTFFLEKFTPGEAERITGCAVSLQAQYRSRSLIPSSGGAKNARFDVFQLALLLFVRSMNVYDLGFTCARTLAPWVIDAIVRRVLVHGEAFDLAGLDADDDMHLEEMAARVMEAHSPSGPEKAGYDGGRFLLIWSDGVPVFCSDIGPELFDAEGTSDRRRAVGPVVVFDTQAAAAEIVARAGRPLVRVGAEAVPFDQFSSRVLAN